MTVNKNHKFVVTLSMDDNIIASRARWIDSYPESIIYSLRLNVLLNDMCDLVTQALKENDIDRAWGILEGFDSHLHATKKRNRKIRRDNSNRPQQTR